jgi:hypothetical protein
MSSETQVVIPGFFLGSGEPIIKADIYNRIDTSKAAVIMIGENHKDPLAHAFEMEILKKLKNNESNFCLSLEFYDRECQTVLDEYLVYLIPLDTFLSDSRPPANQPLVDLSKAVHLPVTDANCPRLYTYPYVPTTNYAGCLVTVGYHGRLHPPGARQDGESGSYSVKAGAGGASGQIEASYRDTDHIDAVSKGNSGDY